MTGVKKSANWIGDDTLALIAALPEIIRRRLQFLEEADQRGHDNILSVARVSARVPLDGTPVDVVGTLRGRPDGTFHHRLHKGDDDVGTRALQPPAEPSLKEDGANPGIGRRRRRKKVGDCAVARQHLTGAMRAMLADFEAAIAASGLDCKVSVRVHRGQPGQRGGRRRHAAP